jgi:DNA-directed RNA polymerase subunit RPC12/RpoP
MQDLSYRCLCCHDSGLINDFNLQQYLDIKNNTSPYAYACTRCDRYLGFSTFHLKKIPEYQCDAIHQSEVERLQSQSDMHEARLKAKIRLAEMINDKSMADQADLEAYARGIDISNAA